MMSSFFLVFWNLKIQKYPIRGIVFEFFLAYKYLIKLWFKTN